MTTTEHLEGQWREWHYAHVAKMFRPYGWTSLVAQYWLEADDKGVSFDLLPGTWSVEDGRVMFTPPASGPNLSVDGTIGRLIAWPASSKSRCRTRWGCPWRASVDTTMRE